MTSLIRLKPAHEPAQALDRRSLTASSGRPFAPAPVRIVHIGLGAFARSHQAHYTAAVDDEGAWGIATFTVRSPEAADVLHQQDGLYCLIERSADSDRVHVVTSISEAADGAGERLGCLLAARTTALVTLTVTEAGYRLRPDGRLDDEDAAIADDIALLREHGDTVALGQGRQPRTVMGRLIGGLAARRRLEGGPIAIVPCDNLPRNGELLRDGALEFARAMDPDLAGWICTEVSFVSTSVDRITPRTTPEDVRMIRDVFGWQDSSPVVAEPFHDWVLSGDFPAGRPEWERAGARFVDDIGPYERRKLWLLNGAHTLLAYAGLLRGHTTVADAISDPSCLTAATEFWDEACLLLPADLQLAAYRDSLIERFRNPRIVHYLEQISADGLAKLRARVVPVALEGLARGQRADASASVVAAWASFVLSGRPLQDQHEAAVRRAGAASDPIPALLGLIDPALTRDAQFVEHVRRSTELWTAI